MSDYMEVDGLDQFEDALRNGRVRIQRADPALYEAHEQLTRLLTAPDLPAGTGREQSYVNQCINSVAENYRNLNHETSAAGGMEEDSFAGGASRH